MIFNSFTIFNAWRKNKIKINGKGIIRTIILLTASNIFMTIAWYGHLKQKNVPLWKAIMVSWVIPFFEYCLMVPANGNG